MEALNRFQVIYSDTKTVKLQMKSNPNLSLDLQKEIKTNKVSRIFEKTWIISYDKPYFMYINTFTSNFLFIVDESMVAQMLNNPSAMKMVLKYLTKQNLKEQQKKWHKMSKSNGSQKTKRKSNTTKPKKKTTTKPPATTTTKKPKTKSPILQITQIKRRNDNGGPPKNEEKQVLKSL